MNKKAIIIDTGNALTEDLISNNNIRVMGMHIIIDDKRYIDYHELKKDHFYDIIRTADEFHTAHPSLGEIKEEYEKIKKEGYEELFDIHFSSKMSGLYNTAHMAKNMVNGLKINIIDTENVSIGGYLIAEKCVELINNNKSFEEIQSVLPEIRNSSFMQFTVPNLTYLVKNGRVGKAQGLAGTLLNIKPILGVDEGLISPINKIRGMKKVLSTMVNNAVDFLKDKPNNIKIYYTHGFEENKESLKLLENLLKEKLDSLNITDYKTIRGRLYPTIACHSGPDVIGLAVYGEKIKIE